MRKFFTLIILGFICLHLSAQQVSNGSGASASSGTSSFLSGMESNAEYPQIRIYPNPAGDRIQITISEKMIGSTIRVHSLLGTEVLSRSMAEGQEIMDVSALPQGLYLYNVIDKNNKTVLSGKFNKL